MFYKYRGEKEQVSTDNGQTWTDTGVVRPMESIVNVYNYQCACEGTCYEITPNVIISSGDGGNIGSLSDRGDGCMTWTTSVVPEMDRTFIITIKDLNTFEFLFNFGCGTSAQSFRMEVYNLDDINMERGPLIWSNVTSPTRAVFLNIGGGTHQIPVHIYQSGGGWDASCAIIDFDCEYNPNYPTLTDNMPVSGWSNTGYNYSVEVGEENDLVFSVHNCTRLDFRLTSQFAGQYSNYLAVMDVDSDTTVIGTSPRPANTSTDYGERYITVDNIPQGDHTIKIKNYCGRPSYRNTKRTIELLYFT